MSRRFSILLAVACAAFANAYADDITIDPHPFVSTASRAQVRAELDQFRRTGVNPWADEYNPLPYLRSGRTRAEVTEEFLGSRREVNALSAEDSGSAYLARMNAGSTPRATALARAE